ncbi:MAG: MFS transporter, partial [Armatimonadota bacterium]
VAANLRATFGQSRAPLQDRNFVRLLAFTGAFAASQTFAGNFFAAYALESLNLPFFNLTLTGIAHACGTVATVRAWGYLSDKYGNKPVLTLAMFGVILTPGMWLLCHANQTGFNTALLLTGHVFNGIVWSGVGVTQFNLNMGTGKAEHRANSLALLSAVTAVCGAIAPMLGSSLLTGLSFSMDRFHAYHITFVVTIVIRIFALVMLIPVHERGATSIRSTLRQLRKVKPSGVAALRAMQSSETEHSRAGAIERVGENQMTLATDELSKALSDPSPRVRRQAALALGRLGTKEAGRALLQHIHNHPDLIDEE